MKKISFLLTALLCTIAGMAADEVLFSQTYPGSPSAFVNAYNKSFTITTDGYTLTYSGINNGTANNNWDILRAGSKNDVSVATIISDKIESAVAKVMVNLTEVTVAKVNSIKLYIASDANFSSDLQTIAADNIAVGEVNFVIAKPAANMYYKIEFDLAKGTANGFLRFDKVVFYKGEATDPSAPAISADDHDFGTLLLEDTVVRANYTISVQMTNLTEEVKISVLDVTGGPSANFTADKQTLPVTYSSDRVTISFVAREVGVYSAVLNLTSGNTYKNVELKATVKAPFVKKEVYTVEEIVALYDEITIPTTDTYTVEGYITYLRYATYGSNGAAFWIADTKDGATNLFQIYQLTTDDEESKSYAIGDKIRATGTLVLYGTTKEMMYGTYQIIEKDVPAEDKGATTIANFLQLADIKNIYHLTGVVQNIKNTEYGNFDLVDGNDKIYIYGLLTAEGEKQQFASLNIEAGDTLEVKGTYTTYNNAPQIANAVFVSLKKASSDTPSALEDIRVQLDTNAPMYNLLGVQVDEQYKGVVIQNKKKFLLK